MKPPWVCWTKRKGASKDDIGFWVARRGLIQGFSKEGKRIYGEGLEEDKPYELVAVDQGS
jgi:hypothetical protein